MAQAAAHVDTIAGHRADSAVRAAARSAEAEAVGAAALAFVLYLTTCARDVEWGDAAKLTLYVWRFLPSLDQEVHLGAIAWAWPFAQLPVGRFALRVAIASVAASALTVGFVHVLLIEQCRSRWAARAGTASLVVSHTFWFVSTIAESYAVAMLSVSAAAWLLVNRSRSRPLSAGLVLGFGAVANPIALFGVPAAIWRLMRRAETRPAAGRLTAGVVIGITIVVVAAAPFLATPPRSTVSEWARVLRSYMNWRLPLINLRLLAAYAIYNFAGAALFLIVRGVMRITRVDRIALGLYAGAHYAVAAYYLPQRSYLIAVPVYLAAAWLVATGADDVIDRGFNRPPWAVLASVAIVPPLLYAATAVVLGAQLPPVVRDAPFRDERAYFLQPWKSGDTSVRRYIDALDHVIPDDAAVFGDFTVLMPLIYAHRVEAWKVHCAWLLTDGQSAESVTDAVDGYLAAGRHVFLLDARYFPVDPGAHWDVVPASVERLVELRKR